MFWKQVASKTQHLFLNIGDNEKSLPECWWYYSKCIQHTYHDCFNIVTLQDCLLHHTNTSQSKCSDKYKMPILNFSKSFSQGNYFLKAFQTYGVWSLAHLQQSLEYEGREVWTMEYFPNIQCPVLSSVHCVVWWQFLHVPAHSLATNIPALCKQWIQTQIKGHSN